MMTIRPLLVPLVLLAACSKGGGAGASKTATVDLFGKKPVPPGELAKVKADMTQAQVKALFPSIKPTPNHSGSPSLSVDSGYDNAEYRIGFYSDKDAVADITVVVPPDLAKQLDTAWGKAPSDGPMGKEWVNNEDGYEARVSDMGRKTWVSYRPFVPLTADYFGAKPAPFDVLAKVKPGMTRDEIAKAAPGFEGAGAPKGNGSFVPYDGKPKGVRFDIRYNSDDKAEAYNVELPAGGGKLLTKAWGEHPAKASDGSSFQCWDADSTTHFELYDDRLDWTSGPCTTPTP